MVASWPTGKQTAFKCKTKDSGATGEALGGGKTSARTSRGSANGAVWRADFDFRL